MIQDIIKKKNDVLFLFAVILCIFPFVMTIMFSIPYADDYVMVMQKYNGNNIFTAAYNTANYYYKVWNGLWPYVFLEVLINPLNYFRPYSSKYGLFLVVYFIFFVVVLYVYIASVMKKVFSIEKANAVRICYIMALILILNTGIYPEIYYWFVGNIAYLIGITFMLINQILIINFFDKASIQRGVWLSLFGFLACFHYQLAVFSGVVYLLMMVKKRNVRAYVFFPLLFMILGGGLGAFAPGNFVRHENIYGHKLDVVKAMIDTIQNVGLYSIKFFKNPTFWIAIVICFGAGYKYNNRKEKYNIPALIGLAGVFSVIGMLFPVSLGYSSIDLTNRIEFILNTHISLWIIIFSVYLGGYVSQNKHDYYEKYKTIIYFIAIGMVILSVRTNFFELPWVETFGKMSAVYSENGYYDELLISIFDNSNDEMVLRVDEEKIRVSGLLGNPILFNGGGDDADRYFLEYVDKDKLTVENNY